jgi:reactive intermediate/imine deaminase
VSAGSVVCGAVVTGLPHPLLVPEQNPGWAAIRAGYEEAGRKIAASGAELILIYSTMWPSVVGHQIQARPNPEWVHVDEVFHALGSMPYSFVMDSAFGHAYCAEGQRRGLHTRTVDYHGFPIDTGSVVALKLLNPDNAIPACIVSSNVYADRAETVVLGKAAAAAIAESGKKAAVVVVTSLSNRLFTDFIDPADDHIHSPKDEEWNRKLLEFLGDGRLEDTAQLSREIHKQVRVSKVVNFKPMWWLSAAMGQHNKYEGQVHAYAPIHGTGGCVVTLTPSPGGIGDKEFDEDNVETYAGDRGVLSGKTATDVAAPASAEEAAPAPGVDTINAAAAPAPVGAYPHARRVGDLLYLSGVGPRQPGTDAIPGGAIRDASGAPQDYDIAAQTRAVIENIRVILEASGSSLDEVVDVTVFLVDMDRDFAGYNAVYREYFEPIQATRTTLAIRALPTPIAVEFKVIAKPGEGAQP